MRQITAGVPGSGAEAGGARVASVGSQSPSGRRGRPGGYLNMRYFLKLWFNYFVSAA